MKMLTTDHAKYMTDSEQPPSTKAQPLALNAHMS